MVHPKAAPSQSPEWGSDLRLVLDFESGARKAPDYLLLLDLKDKTWGLDIKSVGGGNFPLLGKIPEDSVLHWQGASEGDRIVEIDGIPVLTLGNPSNLLPYIKRQAEKNHWVTLRVLSPEAPCDYFYTPASTVQLKTEPLASALPYDTKGPLLDEQEDVGPYNRFPRMSARSWQAYVKQNLPSTHILTLVDDAKLGLVLHKDALQVKQVQPSSRFANIVKPGWLLLQVGDEPAPLDPQAFKSKLQSLPRPLNLYFLKNPKVPERDPEKTPTLVADNDDAMQMRLVLDRLLKLNQAKDPVNVTWTRGDLGIEFKQSRVVHLKPGLSGEKLGIQEGDVLDTINGDPVTDANEEIMRIRLLAKFPAELKFSRYASTRNISNPKVKFKLPPGQEDLSVKYFGTYDLNLKFVGNSSRLASSPSELSELGVAPGMRLLAINFMAAPRDANRIHKTLEILKKQMRFPIILHFSLKTMLTVKKRPNEPLGLQLSNENLLTGVNFDNVLVRSSYIQVGDVCRKVDGQNVSRFQEMVDRLAKNSSEGSQLVFEIDPFETPKEICEISVPMRVAQQIELDDDWMTPVVKMASKSFFEGRVPEGSGIGWVNDEMVKTAQEFTDCLTQHAGEPEVKIGFLVEYPPETFRVVWKTSTPLGARFEKHTPTITSIAAKSGLEGVQVADQLVLVDGIQIFSTKEAIRVLRKRYNHPEVVLGFRRSVVQEVEEPPSAVELPTPGVPKAPPPPPPPLPTKSSFSVDGDAPLTPIILSTILSEYSEVSADHKASSENSTRSGRFKAADVRTTTYTVNWNSHDPVGLNLAATYPMVLATGTSGLGQKGVQIGDVVRKVNGITTSTTDEVHRQLKPLLHTGENIPVELERPVKPNASSSRGTPTVSDDYESVDGMSMGGFLSEIVSSSVTSSVMEEFNDLIPQLGSQPIHRLPVIQEETDPVEDVPYRRRHMEISYSWDGSAAADSLVAEEESSSSVTSGLGQKGVQIGNVVRKVNSIPTSTTDEVHRELKTLLHTGENIPLELERPVKPKARAAPGTPTVSDDYESLDAMSTGGLVSEIVSSSVTSSVMEEFNDLIPQLGSQPIHRLPAIQEETDPVEDLPCPQRHRNISFSCDGSAAADSLVAEEESISSVTSANSASLRPTSKALPPPTLKFMPSAQGRGTISLEEEDLKSSSTNLALPNIPEISLAACDSMVDILLAPSTSTDPELPVARHLGSLNSQSASLNSSDKSTPSLKTPTAGLPMGLISLTSVDFPVSETGTESLCSSQTNPFYNFSSANKPDTALEISKSQEELTNIFLGEGPSSNVDEDTNSVVLINVPEASDTQTSTEPQNLGDILDKGSLSISSFFSESPESRTTFNWSPSQGPLGVEFSSTLCIRAIKPQSPLVDTSVEPGYSLTEIKGIPIKTPKQGHKLLSESMKGTDSVNLVFERLEEPADKETPQVPDPSTDMEIRYIYWSSKAEKLGGKLSPSNVIIRVDPNSSLEREGIQLGDQLIYVDDKRADNYKSLAGLLAKARKKSLTKLGFWPKSQADGLNESLVSSAENKSCSLDLPVLTRSGTEHFRESVESEKNCRPALPQFKTISLHWSAHTEALGGYMNKDQTVRSVTKNGFLDRHGVLPGDKLLEINDVCYVSAKPLIAALADCRNVDKSHQLLFARMPPADDKDPSVQTYSVNWVFKEETLGGTFDENLYLTETKAPSCINRTLVTVGDRLSAVNHVLVINSKHCFALLQKARMSKDSGTVVLSFDTCRLLTPFNLSHLMSGDFQSVDSSLEASLVSSPKDSAPGSQSSIDQNKAVSSDFKNLRKSGKVSEPPSQPLGGSRRASLKLPAVPDFTDLPSLIEGFDSVEPPPGTTLLTVNWKSNVQPLGGYIVKDFKLKTVTPGSTLDAAGIQPGDKLISIDGLSVLDHKLLSLLLRQSKGHPKTQLVFERSTQSTP